jgi:hypothetical protein
VGQAGVGPAFGLHAGKEKKGQIERNEGKGRKEVKLEISKLENKSSRKSKKNIYDFLKKEFIKRSRL